MTHLPKIEGEGYEYKAWPSWATGPHGERRVFDSEAEIPAGWTHHDGKKSGKSAKAPPPPPPANAGKAPAGDEGKPEVEHKPGDLDAAGTKLDLFRHTGTLTKSGLWRMKVGVSRPEEESENSPNYVKPNFDL